MKDRVNTINALKGIGILGVVLVHYGSDFSNSIINSFISNGARGVQLLFVINGYLIFYSLDKIELTKRKVISWWGKKFLRLIPLYWFFTILHLLVFGLGPRYYLGPHDYVSGLNIICNLLFLQNFYPYFNCINANWFMGVIAVFYIIAPFLKKVINSLERVICLLCIILPGGYLLMHFLIVNYHGDYLNIWSDYVQILSFFSEFPCICMGIVVFYLEKSGVLNQIKSKKNVSISLLLLALWGAVCLINNKHIFVIGNSISSFGLIFEIVLLSQFIYPVRFICNKLFSTIGKHSYGIYLSHIFILELILDLDRLNRQNYIQWFVGYIMVIMGSLCVALITEKMLEQNKLMKYLQKKINSL